MVACHEMSQRIPMVRSHPARMVARHGQGKAPGLRSAVFNGAMTAGAVAVTAADSMGGLIFKKRIK